MSAMNKPNKAELALMWATADFYSNPGLPHIPHVAHMLHGMVAFWQWSTSRPPALSPLIIIDSTVTAVETFKFLGSIISQDLNWDTHINSIVKKAQQRLYFLRQLRKFNLPQELLKQFYSAIIEPVLCTSITVWFGSATKSGIRRLQRTVRTAEQIIGAPLLTLQELYTSRVRKRAQKITLDASHPSHPLF